MSNFYHRVYTVVRRVPPGHVTTYGTVAVLCGQPMAARAVGYALRALTPANDDVPWQRVVNQAGKISPRGDHGVDGGALQRQLLEREGVTFDAEGRIDMKRHYWDGGLGKSLP